jgi:hypothetical protein
VIEFANGFDYHEQRLLPRKHRANPNPQANTMLQSGIPRLRPKIASAS